MNEKAQSKWTGPDEINGVLHVGKGYRQAFMHLADRLRTDREQWYPGDDESGENGIWGDARPGSFDPAKIYRVPVTEKEAGRRNLYVTFAAGYRKARPEDCWRTDRQEIVFTDDFGAFKWIPATPGENHPSAIYQVPVERKDEPGVHGDSQGEALGQRPPAGQMPYPCKVAMGFRFGNASDRNRLDRMEWVSAGFGSTLGWWCEANPGTYHPNRLYQVPREITAASYPLSQDKGATVQPAAGEFEDGGREGGPDCLDKDASESLVANHLRRQFGLIVDRVDSYIRELQELIQVESVVPTRARIYGQLDMAESVMRILMNAKHSVPLPEDTEPGDDEPEHLTAADFLRKGNAVDHPSHYNAGPIECIDAIRAALTAEEFRGFCKGSTIKYVWRERGKGGDEDLDKGVRFLGWARNDGKGVEE